jgi:hypothetical protein
LRDDILTTEAQRDLDELGIAKNAQEEKRRARRNGANSQDNERMARLYRQHILGEPIEADLKLVQIQGAEWAKPAPAQTGAEAGD